MTSSHSIIAVQPSPASGPGALDGNEAVCSCGYCMSTSLSASEAARLGAAHVAYMERRQAGDLSIDELTALLGSLA
jgi:hypothetical protein